MALWKISEKVVINNNRTEGRKNSDFVTLVSKHYRTMAAETICNKCYIGSMCIKLFDEETKPEEIVEVKMDMKSSISEYQSFLYNMKAYDFIEIESYYQYTDSGEPDMNDVGPFSMIEEVSANKDKYKDSVFLEVCKSSNQEWIPIPIYDYEEKTDDTFKETHVDNSQFELLIYGKTEKGYHSGIVGYKTVEKLPEGKWYTDEVVMDFVGLDLEDCISKSKNIVPEEVCDEDIDDLADTLYNLGDELGDICIEATDWDGEMSYVGVELNAENIDDSKDKLVRLVSIVSKVNSAMGNNEPQQIIFTDLESDTFLLLKLTIFGDGKYELAISDL